MENIVQCDRFKGGNMAHKTFISYKWSEAQKLRDDIIDGARQRFTICHELGHLLLDIKNRQTR